MLDGQLAPSSVQCLDFLLPLLNIWGLQNNKKVTITVKRNRKCAKHKYLCEKNVYCCTTTSGTESKVTNWRGSKWAQQSLNTDVSESLLLCCVSTDPLPLEKQIF